MQPTLDPQARVFLDRLAAARSAPLWTLSPAAARAASAKLVQFCAGPPAEVASVTEREIPGPRGPIRTRTYTPLSVDPARGLAPVLVYFHGGGFVIGDLDMVDATCRLLARGAECIVVSVDYRLAPEHRYPAPREDAYAATAWVAREAASFGGDPERIAVGGDSAGATLAAIVTLVARDGGGPRIGFQLLVYPGSDRNLERPSMLAYGQDYLLTLDTMRWFLNNHYDGPSDVRDPYLTPLDAGDFTNLPPALVITAGFDPLRDGGQLYAERLRAAGVPTEYVCYEGMIHGFFTFPSVFDAARAAIERAADSLRRAFAESDSAEVGLQPAQ
jgi:acetyl esterase